MSRKVMQIGYEPERDRLTWDGWDIHCGHGMDVLLPDRLDGGTWRTVSFESIIESASSKAFTFSSYVPFASSSLKFSSRYYSCIDRF
jgi:hypothetical protein